MKKIISIVGARPQFIKLAMVTKELRKLFKEIIIHTGQHYDKEMSDYFFSELEIPKPDYNLNIGSGSHGVQTANMMIEIEKKLIELNPDYVLIYGDTNSTVAASLAAVKLHIPVGHVEAGLRNFDLKIPEEVNRKVSDHLSNHLFAPTPSAVENLHKEGLSENTNFTGDVMYDSVLFYSKLSKIKSCILEKLNLTNKNYKLITLHRPNNVDDKDNLLNILNAIQKDDSEYIFPIHPRTKKNIEKFSIKIPKNCLVINPVSYLDNLNLIQNSEAVITDSGGLQKEAYLLNKKCVTIFPNTAWLETLSGNWNVLASPNIDSIINSLKIIPNEITTKNEFGDGKASNKIVDIINHFIS